MGRALLAGAAMFEMAVAAGASLSSAVMDEPWPILADALISAACVLDIAASSQRLSCLLNLRCDTLLTVFHQSCIC